MTHPTSSTGSIDQPKSSTPITVAASGPFAAAPNRATNPRRAAINTVACVEPNHSATVTDSVAPITNDGVTSPPGNPEPSVAAVNTNLRTSDRQFASPSTARLNTPSDRPVSSQALKTTTNAAATVPPSFDGLPVDRGSVEARDRQLRRIGGTPRRRCPRRSPRTTASTTRRPTTRIDGSSGFQGRPPVPSATERPQRHGGFRSWYVGSHPESFHRHGQ